MQDQDSAKATRSNGVGFIGYAGQRLILAVILVVALLGGTAYLLNHFNIKPATPSETVSHGQPDSDSESYPPAQGQQTALANLDDTPHEETTVQTLAPPAIHQKESTAIPTTGDKSPPAAPVTSAAPVIPLPANQQPTVGQQTPEAHVVDPGMQTPIAPPTAQSMATQSPNSTPKITVRPDSHPTPAPAPAPIPAPGVQPIIPHGPEQGQAYRPRGVAFLEAVIKPMDNELNQHLFGWRPNDIIILADNTKNYQLGVLEVTRRTMVHLAEHISRTGSTDAFNPHVENAMNWFMVKADRYWFPSPESKYKEGLKELEAFKQELIEGKATLYTRADNLIPLLEAYENLLGSCDENLVKHTEMDGSKVSMFKTDNYFYYAKGIASALAVILEAIHHDFAQTLENRNGSDLLHHAVVSCNEAAGLSPWFITDSDLDGLFANHRANMAAPISHARFYLSQLIKTLST